MPHWSGVYKSPRYGLTALDSWRYHGVYVMPDLTQSNRIETPAAKLAVREFCAEAVRRAGGKAELVRVLVELDFRGRDEDGYNEKSIEAWMAGRRMPSAAVLIALALRLRIALDGIIAAAEDVEEVRAATAGATEEAAERLREARGLMLVEGEKAS